MDLKKPELPAQLECLRVVAKALQQEASWTEGCSCHETIRCSSETYAKRRSLISEAVGAPQCVWEGKTGTEMALKRCQVMAASIRASTPPRLQDLCSFLSPEHRRAVLIMCDDLKLKLSEILTMKLSFWEALPWKLLGLFGHFVGKAPEAKQCARECIAQYRELDSADRLGTVHRVAAKFFVADSVLWLQMKAFAEEEPRQLEDLPELFIACQHLALSPISERWIEGAHKDTKQAFNRGLHHSPAGACARLRRPETLALFKECKAKAWLLQGWGRKYSMSSIVTSIGLSKPQSDAELFSLIYCFNLDSLFRDMAAAKSDVEQFKGKETQLRLKGVVKTPWDLSLAIQFLRERLTPGTVFSMPASLIGMATGALARDQARLVRHDLVEGGCDSIVDDVIDRLHSGEVPHLALEDEPCLLALADAPGDRAGGIRVEGDQGDGDDDIFGDIDDDFADDDSEESRTESTVFFKVIENNPEKRQMAQSASVDLSRCVIAVTEVGIPTAPRIPFNSPIVPIQDTTNTTTMNIRTSPTSSSTTSH